ncbi:MAG TPA: hypothetical protein VEA69_23645 [Tepidisphaeraceae bacterium]|nr:hypothetical protein [Tepidisphaeraceae bacterium]
MEFVRIVALCVVAAVVYGIVHDQVTARVCVEYFTIGHAPVFDTADPTLLGLGWGVIATWWVGLILGVALAACAVAGRRPVFGAGRLVRPLVVMLLIVGALAAVAGFVGHAAASVRAVWLLEPMASRVPMEKHAAFLADLWAHSASYIGGFVGGVVLCVYVLVWRSRAARRLAEPPVQSSDFPDVPARP